METNNLKMSAFVRTQAGNQEVKLTEVPIPINQNDEVLIQVEAFGVGIHDRYFIPAEVNFSYVIGSEGSGVIKAIGDHVTDFQAGDRVIFTTILQPQGGSWAKYAVAKQSALILLPPPLTFAQGASVPVAGKMALECIRAINIKQGDQLFIAGASGAIGTLVIQLAVKMGIRVSASASEKNHSYMKSLGAEETVDYNDTEWQDKIIRWSGGGVSAVLAIQPGTAKESVGVVKAGGKLITVSGDHATVPIERNIVVQQMGHHPETHQKVVELVKMMAAGAVKVVLQKEYSFEQALEALAKTETRHARGKLVVNTSL